MPLVDAGDTRLYVDERGTPDGLPVLILHGGPGLDHTEFADHLDPLGDEFRLLLVDQREQGRSERGTAPETWTLEQMARDVGALAQGLGLDRYAVLGHSYGAFVALQHAVDDPRGPAASIISSGLPSERWLAGLDATLEAFEPVELREQVKASWARESEARTPEDVAALIADQLPFHFADPYDPRAVLEADTVYAPEILAHAAANGYGSLDVEHRLGEIAHPVLVMTGRHDRLCTPEAAEFMSARIPGAELVILERSAHMGFVEEPEAYRVAVRDFLTRRTTV
jgi:pimeloyl-ACP methyl ester carboxylesterase